MWYTTLPVVCVRPSDGNVWTVQPAAAASVLSVASSFAWLAEDLVEDLPVPPPVPTATTIAAIAAPASTPPTMKPMRRLRALSCCAARSAASRSWRRRSFSCWRLDIGCKPTERVV